ncbi:hypothetical protein JCM10908_001715 [Rhodotorula pacifica]|uniref:uncharacterized protein n=1 Tax=Rhodotorula pacifica TaxID=1495444 RepID=UPI00317E27B1
MRSQNSADHIRREGSSTDSLDAVPTRRRSLSRVSATDHALARLEGNASEGSRPRTSSGVGASTGAGAARGTPQPFLPDEVLEALARDPPPPPTSSSSRLVGTPSRTTKPAPPSRQSVAFDRSFVFDVPSLVGASSAYEEPPTPPSAMSPRAPEQTQNPRTTPSTSLPERRTTLRNLVHTRMRSSALPSTFEAKSDSASRAASGSTPARRRAPTQAPHSSAWSRIAAASPSTSSASANSNKLDARSSRSRSDTSRSDASFTSSTRTGDADWSERIDFRLPALENGSSPHLERALAELALEAPMDPPDPISTASLTDPTRIGQGESSAAMSPAQTPEADFVVAVIGPKSVGKSTLIRRGLKRASSEPRQLLLGQGGHVASSTVSSFTMAGIRQTIEVIKVDSEIFDWNGPDLDWPPAIPQAEAVMLCYDASDPDALSGLSRLLRAFWSRGSDVPLIVLACKSSAIGSDAVDPQAAADLCDSYGAGIVRLDGGTEDPQRKSKECFSWVIRQIMDNRGETHFFAALATPTEVLPSLQPDQFFPPQGVEDDLETRLRAGSPPLALSLVEVEPVTIDSPTKVDAGSSLPDVAPQQANESSLTTRRGSTNLLFRPEDLIDKFLHASLAGDDDDFVNLFLITFRRFVTPSQVLQQLVDRFHFISEQRSETTLKRYGHLRLCSTLSTWLLNYPGDFADSETLERLRRFVEIDLPQGGAWLSHHVYELTPLLPSLSRATDPDASWSSSVPPASQQNIPGKAAPRLRDPLPMNRSQASLASTFCSSDAPSLTEDSITSSAGRSRQQQGEQVSLDSKDSSLGSASSPMTRQLSGVTARVVDASNALAEMREEDIAAQITRLAWDLLAGITPRDAMRHVLARKDESDAVKGSPIARSIDFVNHLARWAATMILVQSRPKQRAVLVEKLILVATELRASENFDSLMGVLAGLNSQAVHRLSDTFEIVADRLDGGAVRAVPGEQTRQPKKLRSLNLLMAPAKSFAAYRLALSASSRDALPYLGVVLQDLTVINETSADFEDGLVNWSKFASLGRSCSILLDCPRTPPPSTIDNVIEKCILDVPLLDEDRLYTLSYAYQPRDGKSAGRSRLREIARNALS